MKLKLVRPFVLKVIITIFLMMVSFIFGASITKTINFDPIEQSKINVSNLLVHPETAKFRDMAYYFNRNTGNGGKLGYICGEVLIFNSDDSSSTFKRFIVKVYDPPSGLVLLSFPIIEGGEDALLSERIDDIWKMFCHK